MNPMDLFRLKGFWDRFSAAHPKLVPFWKSVYPAAFGEGTIVDVKITDPSGRNYHYNLRFSAEDMQNFKEARELIESMARDLPRG
ncbi:MAG: hypothetical protein VZR05_04870 [Lachnospiraceae bacterium]|jgi:hypothetical protein|nr:hypothetical protein [Lachnospiraceae bacterium]MBR6397799.1 hypothetical protein [Lachnospiraceae bacterium]MBR7015747.1 hypothetical protein [Lachnospiraceae bacterium]MEE1109684.1 hypothetical protein [Lachnospiraceae bacterium]MEE3377483.1 hypothetical protein [Lachnospiraceae bacterium]